MLKMPCPKCRRGQLRQHVNVFVECSVGNTSLNKKGIKSPDVKIMGVGWDTAMWFCTNAKCGYMNRLGAPAPKKKRRRHKECTCERCQ